RRGAIPGPKDKCRREDPWNRAPDTGRNRGPPGGRGAFRLLRVLHLLAVGDVPPAEQYLFPPPRRARRGTQFALCLGLFALRVVGPAGGALVSRGSRFLKSGWRA